MFPAKQRCFVWFLALFAAIGGFLFGYDIGVINGVKDTNGFRCQFNLTLLTSDNVEPPNSEKLLLGFVVSVLLLGCFVGAFAGSILSELFGRKCGIIIGASVFAIGGTLQAAAVHIGMMFVGRFASGLSLGMLSMITTVYIAEVSPKEIRGKLGTLYQLAVNAGIMVSFIMTYALQPHQQPGSVGYVNLDFGWRISLGLQCLFGVAFGVGMFFLPETPRWLVKKGKVDKAGKVLGKIRKESVAEELKDIVDDVESSPPLKWREVLRILCSRNIFGRLVIGVLLQLFQQFTGINVIMYFSTTIFAKVGVPSFLSTAIIGVTNFLATFLAILLIDKVGRKLLLLFGGAGMCVVVMLSGVLAAVQDDIAMTRLSTSSSAANASNGTSTDMTTVAEYALGYLIVVMVMLFVLNFAYSWGPIVWVVNSEIFPLNIRGVAVSITTSANWISNFALASITPLMVDSRWGSIPGTSGTFFLLSCFLACGFLFVLLVLPETKGKSLEAIGDKFNEPWIQRIGLLSCCQRCCPKACFTFCKELSSSESYTLMRSSGENEDGEAVPLSGGDQDSELMDDYDS
jgi:sugar porter (SP) family MFS transporter